jgi:hypothetical protein
VYRSLQFHKRRQLFIRTHNETLSVTAMRANSNNMTATTRISI